MKRVVKLTRSVSSEVELEIEFPFYREADRCDDYPAPERRSYIAVMSPTLQWHIDEVYTDHSGCELQSVTMKRLTGGNAQISEALLAGAGRCDYTLSTRDAFRSAIERYHAFCACMCDEVGHNDKANITEPGPVVGVPGPQQTDGS